MPLTVTPTELPEVLILQPSVFGDDRGFFLESYNARDFEAATGLNPQFVQDNHSKSARGVLRGLHYQLTRPQGKLVRVVQGEVFDVVVDLRRASPSFGKWVGVSLSSENKTQLWVPEGFGHGFLVTSESAEVLYKTTEYWYHDDDRSLRWNDPTLAIAWPVSGTPLLANKDAAAPLLSEAELY